MRLRLTPLAEQDLESIADYVATDNPRRAITFVQALRQHCQRILLNPPGYRLRPELGDAIRSFAHGNYVIVLEATATDVLVVRILHGARDFPPSLQPTQDVSRVTTRTSRSALRPPPCSRVIPPPNVSRSRTGLRCPEGGGRTAMPAVPVPIPSVHLIASWASSSSSSASRSASVCASSRPRPIW